MGSDPLTKFLRYNFKRPRHQNMPGTFLFCFFICYGVRPPLRNPSAALRVEAEVDDLRDELRKADAGDAGRVRDETHRGHAREGVDLEDDRAARTDDEVDAGYAAEVQLTVDLLRDLDGRRAIRLTDPRRDDVVAEPLRILRLIVVELTL